ncbi:hypothetical protein ZIOFF_069955 [Zingiber officinale]|uniref:Reverse transcriptase Ty1/copia-type domain-containing protein n=1 Tax=Zingiber officinale TaxID=94328 RepID=A0A8J5EUC0_ZINOF|nr:hypothetical protein ZIOFF_069955 [Zingiber officinale]
MERIIYHGSSRSSRTCLWYTVEEEDLPIPGEDAREDEKLRYKNHTINKHKAASLLHDALTESMFTKIANCNTPKNIFDRLKAIHEGGDQIRKIHIRNRISDFEANRMSYKETVQDYYDCTIEIVNEIRALGGELPEEKPIKSIAKTTCCRDRDSRWKSRNALQCTVWIKMKLKKSTSKQQPNFQNNLSTLPLPLIACDDQEPDEAAAGNPNTRDSSRYKVKLGQKKGGRRPMAGDGSELRGLPPQATSKIVEEVEGVHEKTEVLLSAENLDLRHVERVCIHKNRAKEHTNLVDFSLFDEECNLEIAFCTETSPDSVEITYSVDETTTQSIKGWILDSGCSHLMCCDRTLLFNFRTQKGRVVRSATRHTTPVLGVGSIYLSRGKKPMIVEDVSYAPGLTQNLLSFGQILRQKIEILVRGLHLYITDPRNHSVLHAELQQKNFFIFNTHPVQPAEVSMVLNGVTAYEMWHNEKLSLNHLRVYGSICHVHVPDEKRTKLYEKSKIRILVGYCSGIRGYRVFDPVGGKIIISRDIIFEEDKEWDWIGNGIRNSSVIFFNALSKTDQEATKEQTAPSWPMTNEQVITPSAPEIVQNEDQGENGANSDLHDAESTPGTPGNIENEIPDQNSDGENDSATPIRKTRSLADIYAQTNVAQLDVDPSTFFEAAKDEKCYADYSLYVKRSENQVLLVSVYVDDLLITANSPSLITSFKDSVMKEFQMTDLGLMTYFLGMKVHQKKGVGTFVGQTKYCMDLLHKYEMNEAYPVVCPTVYKGAITSITGREKPDAAIYRGIVGSLIYLSHTRPDLSFLVNLLSRYMSQPTSAHLTAAKRALRYVKGTMDLGLFFPATGDNKSFTNLEGYLDKAATPLMIDNQAAIAIAKDPTHFSRAKHIKVRYHALREAVKDKEIQLIHVPTKNQKADMLTKVLRKTLFIHHRDRIGLKSLSYPDTITKLNSAHRRGEEQWPQVATVHIGKK